MKEETNCPNCGAPIIGVQCSYCGMMFYDFADMEVNKVGYLRIKIDGKIVIVKAILTDITIDYGYFNTVDMQLGFHAVKCEYRGN